MFAPLHDTKHRRSILAITCSWNESVVGSSVGGERGDSAVISVMVPNVLLSDKAVVISSIVSGRGVDDGKTARSVIILISDKSHMIYH